jgi:N-methylhydantoinase B
LRVAVDTGGTFTDCVSIADGQLKVLKVFSTPSDPSQELWKPRRHFYRGKRMTLRTADPVELAVFQSAVHSIAEEMGAALRRTALSPNIKERRDYSCAIFDGQGRVIAMGDHMPVHLGSMPMSVQAVIAAIAFAPGDIAILNDPYAGGTHLPDITMVLPVFLPGPGQQQPAFYVSNRAHHADVGGAFAGSMGPANEIFQEGIRIPPIRIVRGGKVDRETLDLILLNVRTPVEREGDLESQIGACRVSEQRILQLVEKYGDVNLRTLIDEFARLFRAARAFRAAQNARRRLQRRRLAR